MNKSELFIKSTCFATQEKLDGKELACGKFSSGPATDNFLFYLLELNHSYPNSKVIKKTIQILDNCCKTAGDEINEENFEYILQNINEGLGRLAESGENSWLGNLNAIVGLINKKEILMSQTGNITGYIFRKNKISAVTERNSANQTSFHPLKTFTDITSGQIATSDHLIFGNSDLFNRISLDRIRTISKEENFHEKVSALLHYLKKNKVRDINAIYIMASDEQDKPDEASPDVLYIDSPDEKIKKIIEKYATPLVVVTKKSVSTNLPIFIKYCKKLLDNSKKTWKDNIKPKSKTILNSKTESVKDNLSKMKQKLPPALKGLTENDKLSKVRIKTHSYIRRKNAGKFSSVLLVVWETVKNLKILFLKENRRYLYAILILIFLSFGYLKLKQNNDKRSQKTKEIQLLNSFDRADQDFKKLKEDLALSKQVNNENIYEVLAMAERSKEIPANRDKAETLIREIKSFLDEKTKTVRFYPTKPSTFADSLKSVSLAGNNIYGINADSKIYRLDTRETESKLIASLNNSQGEPVAMTVSEQKNSLIVTTSKNLMFSMDLSNKTVEELKINADPSMSTWSAANSIATYSSNIYILSSDNGVVWKHSSKEDGYTKGTSYLDTKKISIRGAVDFSIDGNIYVLNNEGVVLKFVKGTLEPDFSIKNVPAPYDKILIPKKIFTDEDTNSLFILDKKYDRILKFDKSGDYSTQYVLDGKPIDNFVVNAKLQKIWILSEGKIYEGNL